MKKKLFTLLAMLLSFLILFPSCGERGSGGGSSVPPEGGTIAPGNHLIDPMFDTDEFLPGYDIDNFFGSHRPWVRVGDTIIHSLENGSTKFFYYYDCNSGESGVLCGKPECTHSSRDCDGFVFNMIGMDLSYCDNKLYWVGSNTGESSTLHLMESDVTGANRRKGRRIDSNLVFDCVNPSFVVHRGYIYHTVVRFRVENGKEIATFVFSSSPVNGKDDESFDEILHIDNEAYMPAYTLFYVGNYVYIALSYSNNYELYKFDSKTREVEKLLGPIPDFRATIWVSQKQEVYLWQETRGEQKLFHLEDGKLVTKMDFSQGERRLYSTLINGIVILSRKVEDNRQHYEIYTVDGKQIYDGILIPEEYKNTSADEFYKMVGPVYGCDENNLYMEYTDDRNKNSRKLLFVRYTFKDGKSEESIVWKGNRYYTGVDR